ncbi:transcriptional regulator [Streptomyces marianii]|uniref:transcriptional regulator n=1 Tax=Streptomyces marianii TaxID=1817406 RepID=UPI001F37019E|nr:transcriptional regulator [Streptomyces marianii]
MSRHVPQGLDEVIHHPTRLQLMAFLSGCAEAEFGSVRDYCGISDASVSRIAQALESAGYVQVRKGYIGRRPRTWLSLTPEGRTALVGHMAALQSLAAAAQQAGARSPGWSAE